MSHSRRKIGAFYQDKSTSFCLWAPPHDQVDVELNGRAHQMEKDADGYWCTTIESVPAGTPYFFKIKGKQLPDPASLSQPEGVHGPSSLVDRSFQWTDISWSGIPLKEMIIYELHVGTFSPRGTFEGVIEKLPYLKSLGINAMELMPIAQFPGTRNWGYDGVYQFAAQSSYGGPSGLKALIDAAHREEIAVILDVVYNHQGPEGNYLGEFGPYFSDKYRTFWGAAINYDSEWCDGVRNFYLENAMMWLQEFHIDGLRLDAVHSIWDNSAKHFIEMLTSEVRQLETQEGKTKVLIAEFDLNNPRYIQPREKGGFGLDGQWIDEYHHALHVLLTKERIGYYEDFGEKSDLEKSLKDSYVYTGQYSSHRKRTFGLLPVDAPYSQFVVFLQNHDQIGNRFLGDRLTTALSFEQLKLAAAAYLLSPHVPMLFMGEEYGETAPFQYFISHTDPKLVKAVREGRKKEFSYFHLEGQVPDPQSEKVFNECKLSWEIDRDANRKTLFAFYQQLISFRKKRSAMLDSSRASLIVWPCDHEEVITFEKTSANDRIFVLWNFSAKAAEVIQPLDVALRSILDSSDKSWNGQGTSVSGQVKPGGKIFVNSYSAIVFESA